MYTHQQHYFSDAPWFENYEDEMDAMFFYDRSEKLNPRHRYHSPRHFYDPNDDAWFFDTDVEEKNYPHYHDDRLYRRASFHRECYCNHCGRERPNYRPNMSKKKNKKNGNSRLNRRRSMGNLPGVISPVGGMNETVWNLPQNPAYSTSLHRPMRDPMTPMASILGPALPPCTTGVQDSSGWFPMTNSMAPPPPPPQPPMPNTNSFMMPNGPMMQPYFLPMPMLDFSNMTYPFPQGYTFPESRPNSSGAAEALPIVTSGETVDKPVVNATSTSATTVAATTIPTHDTNSTVRADPNTQEKHAKGHTMTIPLRKAPTLVHRRKSLVDELVSYFSIFGPSGKNEPIYNTKWNPSSSISLGDPLGSDTTQTLSSKSMSPLQQQQQQQQQQQFEKSSSSPSTSATMTAAVSAATTATKSTTAVVTPTASSGVTPITGIDTSGLSHKASLQLSKKASILSQRPFVWCYRPFHDHANEKKDVAEEDAKEKTNKPESLPWIAFDVNNQLKLDQHYQIMLNQRQIHSPSQQQKAEDTITRGSTIPITKQSRLSGTMVVASYHGFGWYYENGSSQYQLFEIGRVPSDHNSRFVVSNDVVEKDQRLRRSKSLDKLASKLFNTVLGKQ